MNKIIFTERKEYIFRPKHCLQPLQIPDVKQELIPPPCASVKSNTNRFAVSCRWI